MSRCTRISSSVSPRGFTLVELLVALGLVALILLLFAQIFTIASGTMSTQRGIMENDQRARMLTTIITSDLKNRTMRSVMPFQPGEKDAPTAGYYSFSQRLGFLSISENDPNNDADDVLHLTTFFSPQTSDDLTSSDADVYYGRATQLADIEQNPNQPEADDSSTFQNYTASSHMAEVVYFVRNGNLYRRVLLIREPLNSAFDSQPSDSTGKDLFDYNQAAPPTRYALGSDFWRDFDFSATWPYVSGDFGAKFIGSGSAGLSPLDNSGSGSITYPSIALPKNRFGHNPIDADGNGSGVTTSIANPREYVGSMFIGRFTQEETSHTDFNYPHSKSVYGTLGVPMDPVDTPAGTVLADTTPQNGVIDQFEQGPRRGEDILMSNVHGFDVKVWDEALSPGANYVDVGNALGSGDFQSANNQRTTYGPDGPPGNRVFDTWHPHFDANGDGNYSNGAPDTNDNPPFTPNYNNNNWVPDTQYKVGAVVVPSTGYPGGPTGYAYKATNITNDGLPVNSANSAATSAEEPAWPALVGTTIPIGKSVSDTNTTDNTTITWTTIPNVKRLRSLKITIRYLDVSSDQMRQVTLIQSLID